jgi:dTDP-glucose 4,6-dehydratase
MKLLVTGCAGFIGSNFVHYMLQGTPYVQIVGLDNLTYAGNLYNLQGLPPSTQGCFHFVKGDICDHDLLKRLFQEEGIQAVVHFAAETHVDRSIHDSHVFLQTNVMGTHALLEAAKHSWLSGGTWKDGVKFIQISTDEVYGSLGPTGLFSETTPLDPHSPYSASKASADMLAKSFADTYGLPVCITRCSNNYGPYQFPEKLIPLMICNALNHQKLPIYGDGQQIRDWLYVTDHCTAINLVLQKGRSGEVYNIGGNNERFNIDIVRSVLRIIQDLTGDKQVNEDLILYVKDRPGHDRRYGIDSSKIRHELGWVPCYPLDEGLVQTVCWYLDNSQWVDKVISGEYKCGCIA